MELKFNHAAAEPQYNGNIGGMSWKSARSTKPAMEYRFGYDKLDRLRSSKSSGGGITAGSYNEYVDYGDRGKIESLGCYALVSGVRQQIDSLKYTYDHDRHIKIDDISMAAAGIKALGFNEKVQQAVEYVYDGNGRVVSDANLGIERISYNELGLIDTIRWSGTSGQQTVYLYDALGSKLQSSYVQDGITLTTDYVGGIQYRKEGTGARILDFVHTAEGRARKSGTTFRYEYDQRDHLGNVRLSVDVNPSDPLQRTARIIQENGYYPFGLVMSGPELNFALGDKNEYLYNGKELQRGTGWYNYGARQYDASIGRWHAPDPLAENHYDLNSYHYVMNNPMLYMDYMGLDTLVNGGEMEKGVIFVPRKPWFIDNDWSNTGIGRQHGRGADYWMSLLSLGSSGKKEMSEAELIALRKAQDEAYKQYEKVEAAKVKNIQDNYGKDAGGKAW